MLSVFVASEGTIQRNFLRAGDSEEKNGCPLADARDGLWEDAGSGNDRRGLDEDEASEGGD